MAQNIEAKELRSGDTFRYEGREYHVFQKVSADGIVDIYWTGGEFPMSFYADSLVILVHRDRMPDPKPYIVYTRSYKANGDCDKRIHRFATRKAQIAFMDRTNACVTYWN